MKLWNLHTDECNYDQYDSMVIAAETETDAREICQRLIAGYAGCVGQHIADWTSEEIGTATPHLKVGVVVSSYNAG